MASDAPIDFLFIDTVLLAYRLGNVCYEEQRAALVESSKEATDAFTFLHALECRGVGPHSKLYAMVGRILSAPTSYRTQHPQMLGLRREGVVAPPFLKDQQVLFLVEPMLSPKQRKLFYDTYWWFVHNHQPVYIDVKKGRCIGLFATDPKDNASVLARFEEHLNYLVHHRTQYVRRQFEDFPVAIVLAILRRAFL